MKTTTRISVFRIKHQIRHTNENTKVCKIKEQSWTLRECLPKLGVLLRFWVIFAVIFQTVIAGNPDAKRLYDDLLSNYNKLVRPVVNTTDVLRVCIKLKLSQLIDVVSNIKINQFF